MLENTEKNRILEAVVREMHSGVLALDSHGFVLYANPYFTSAFPAPERVEGRPLDEIFANADLLARVKLFIEDSSLASDDIEITEGGKSLKVRIVRLPGRDGFSLLLFLHDITEEKRVETIKKDFVANVSHELRTPLASIKGYSETLLDGAMEDAETSREFLRIIDKHATRMTRLIDDLLILSRLESHQMPEVSGSVDVGELVSATTTGYRKQAKDKGVELKTLVPEDLPRVSGDRDRLEQVVVNLLDNAIKYTPSGGRVKVAAAHKDGTVTIEVTDTGIGIPPEDISRIFERFYRVDKARSRELGGTGLGLAIVKHIVQGMGGALSVESTPGEGSTFSVSFKAGGGSARPGGG